MEGLLLYNNAQRPCAKNVTGVIANVTETWNLDVLPLKWNCCKHSGFTVAFCCRLTKQHYATALNKKDEAQFCDTTVSEAKTIVIASRDIAHYPESVE